MPSKEPIRRPKMESNLHMDVVYLASTSCFTLFLSLSPHTHITSHDSVCGDRPVSKAKSAQKNPRGAVKRVAWQRYCVLCQQVFTMNGFFAKHGTTSVEDERALENRAKKHKLKLLDMAKRNAQKHYA